VLTRDELCGRTVGEFVLRERIGEGGFGAVYRCEQPLLGREAVVKVLHRGLRASDVMIQRFLREARLASRIDHPYAAHVYAFGVEKDDGLMWIAMEMVHGTPLDRWLRDRGPLSVAQLVPFFERIAEVVHTAHESGIVHRDLKPSNVMVIERAGRLLPKLLDLGIAKLLDDEELPNLARPPLATPPRGTPVAELAKTMDPAAALPASEAATIAPTDDAVGSPPNPEIRLTQAGGALGSPPYMAPEQWHDAPRVGPRSDLYALAIVAYEAVAGRRPFEANTITAFADLHARATVPPLGDPFPPALDRFFARALAKSPDDRWATALELAAALRVAAGLGDTSADLPRLDEGVRDAWIADAPQPLAEAVASLDGARNVHELRDAAWDLARGTLRYLLAMALAARAQVRDEHDNPDVLDLLREMRRRDLADDERIRLLRVLVRPADQQAAPIPELADLRAPAASGRDVFDALLDKRTSTDGAVGDDLVRSRVARLIADLGRLLRSVAFVLDYSIVVPRGDVVELWTGLRRARRALVAVRGAETVARQPLLIDRDGRAVLALWPLVQVHAATGDHDEMFVFDGRGRHGARLVASPAGFEHHDAAVWEWFGEHVVGDSVDTAAGGDPDVSPYLGLATYTAADAARFVGREREVELLVNRMRTQPLLIVVGASGAGKSSFVHAGVIPALPAGWRVIAMRPGATPHATLLARLSAIGAASPSIADVTRVAGDGTIVVFVDQLEELFALSDDGERDRFVAVVGELASSADAPVRVIATVRDDFLMRVQKLAPLRARLASAMFLLGTPARDDLARTIVEPARAVGYTPSDPELVAEMVDAVADRPAALALLSFTASRLWELRDRRFRQLTRKAYDAMGGVGGALGQHAESTLDALGAAEQLAVRDTFRHLVTAEGTRAVLAVAELRQILGERADAVIDKLVAARLVVIDEGEGEPQIEIAHEALIDAWPRLQGWIREDLEGARFRDQLRGAARQWHERGRPRGLLWRDEVLADLVRWRRRADAALTDVETAFADASQNAAMRGRRIRRALLATAFVVLGGTAIVMYQLQRTASESGALAKQRLIKNYEERGRQALLAGQTDSALVFLSEALSMGDDRPVVRFMIGKALEPRDAEVARLRGHVDKVWRVSFDPDGARVLTSSSDGTARIWDARDGKPLAVLADHAGEVRAAWSPDGTSIATGDAAGVVRLWSADGRLVATSPSPAPMGAIYHVVWSPDGTSVATSSNRDGFVRLWSPRDATPIAAWHVGDDAAGEVEFDPEGRRVATGSALGKAAVWSLDGTKLATLSHAHPVWFARFDPEGDRVATSSLDETAAIWDLATGTPTILEGHDARVTHVAWDPTGATVATASADRTARIWDLTTGKARMILRGHSAQVNRVAFTRDGRQLVTIGADGTARVWDPESGAQTALFSHPGFLFDVSIDHHGTRLATASWSGTGAIWEASKQLRIASMDAGDSVRVMRHAAGRTLAIGDHGARIWNRYGDASRALPVAPSVVSGALTPDGLTAALGDIEGTLHLYGDAGTRAVAVHTGAVLDVVAADGVFVTWGADRQVAATTTDGTTSARVRVDHDGSPDEPWRAQLRLAPSGSRMLAFDIEAERATLLSIPDLAVIAVIPVRVNAAAFSNRGDLVTASDDHVRVWRSNGKRLVDLPNPNKRSAITVAWSDDARTLVTGDKAGTIEVWTAADWSLRSTTRAHDAYVGAAVITHDGAFVLTGSQEPAVKMWAIDTLDQVAMIPTSDVLGIELDRENRLLVSGSRRIDVWSVGAMYRGSAAELARFVACHVPAAVVNGRLEARDPPARCE
jgi:WD40 repeat protein/serine/threonine protein kinase